MLGVSRAARASRVRWNAAVRPQIFGQDVGDALVGARVARALDRGHGGGDLRLEIGVARACAAWRCRGSTLVSARCSTSPRPVAAPPPSRSPRSPRPCDASARWTSAGRPPRVTARPGWSRTCASQAGSQVKPTDRRRSTARAPASGRPAPALAFDANRRAPSAGVRPKTRVALRPAAISPLRSL